MTAKGTFLAFYLGIQLSLQLQQVPGTLMYCLIPVCVFFLFCSNVYRYLAVFILAALYTLFYSSVLLSDRFPEDWSGKRFTLIGKIVELPEIQDHGVRFIVKIDALIDEQENRFRYHGRARLSWRAPEIIPQTGQTWQLKTKLRAPHGFANPGAFDYEFWLFHQRINTTGYVVADEENRMLTDSFIPSIHSIRQTMNNKLDTLTQNHSLSGLVQGVLTGTRSQITTEQWQILRNTGTSHLMAISGLHITLIASLFYALVRFCSRVLPIRNSTLVIQHYALSISFIAALIYSLLAGFSLPTQRALIMLAVAYMALLSRYKCSVGDILASAAIAVLLYDPFAVRTAGFYLSFIAVGFIFLVSVYRIGERNKLKDALHAQWAITLGLLPLSLYFFQSYPLLSLPANLIAVPVMAGAILPGLIASFFAAQAHWAVGSSMMNGVLYVFDWLWCLLQKLAGFDFLQWHSPPMGLISLALIYIIVVFIVLPPFFQRRYVILLALLAVILSARAENKNDRLKITVLDVGQGLSIVIQIKDYVLLYDAGPAYSESFDTGKMVVVPYLLNQKIADIDTFIISHQDNDHAGGSQAVMQRFSVDELISDNRPNGSKVQLTSCTSGMKWVVYGAKFEILHPELSFQGNKNNRSCVLKVTYQDYAILIPGDIEASAENALLSRSAEKLAADLLIAPHHGSASSSSKKFIAAVNPTQVIFSSGYQNRYQFPKQVIIKRYKTYGVDMLQTSVSGAISISIYKNEQILEQHRDKHRRFWHHSVQHSET